MIKRPEDEQEWRREKNEISRWRGEAVSCSSAGGGKGSLRNPLEGLAERLAEDGIELRRQREREPIRFLLR
jgi:hypothetical protein